MSGYISDILFTRLRTPPPVTLSAEQLAEIAAQIPPTDITGKVDKVTGSALLATTEAAKIHSMYAEDLSDYVVKVTGSSLVTDTEITKLENIEANANNYTHPANHTPSIITQDISNRFVSDTEKSTWNGKSTAPNDAQKNSDITKAEIEAKLIDEITSHTHPGVGAQVQTDWNATTGLGELLNKPTIPVVRRFANLAAPVVTSGTTEKVLFQMVIPPAWAVVGSTFRAWIIGNSSSTGTLIFKVRCGAGGTITDTIDWTAVTSAAQVANARAGFEVLITVRSATTIAVHGVGYAGAIQLPTVIAVPATPAITISGTWWINLTVICSSGTFTCQVGSIEEIK